MRCLPAPWSKAGDAQTPARRDRSAPAAAAPSTMAAADDKKKKQKTTESLDDAVKQLGLSKRAIHEVVRVATARAAELSGQRVGMDLLHALTRRIKSEEGQPSSEQVKEQCLYAMHECLMQIDGIGKASGKLCSQIETLAEKCTEHVPRTLIKARGSRAPIAEHLSLIHI